MHLYAAHVHLKPFLCIHSFPIVASLSNLLHPLYAVRVHAKSSLGLHTLQHGPINLLHATVGTCRSWRMLTMLMCALSYCYYDTMSCPSPLLVQQ